MKKIIFAFLCLGLIFTSCDKDEEKVNIGVVEKPNGGEEEKPIVLPKDTIVYKDKISYDCWYAFTENSQHTLNFTTNFNYDIVIKTDLNWNKIKEAFDTKVNILQYHRDGLSPLINEVFIKNVSSPFYGETEVFDLKKSEAYIDFIYSNYERGTFYRLVFKGENTIIKVLLKYEFP